MISLIIPTLNRADMLDETLGSLSNQTISTLKYEIIIINNGSTDHTEEVIKKHKNNYKNLISVIEERKGLHYGRHKGLEISKGDILVFADDDIEPLPEWLESIDLAFRDSSIAMVAGNNLPKFTEDPPDWITKLWNRKDLLGRKMIPQLSVIKFKKSSKYVSPYLVWGCNFPIRKSVLLDAGGFNPDGMPSDLSHFRGDGETRVSRYVAEQKLKTLYVSEASIFHKVTPERMTYQYFKKRGFNQGISDSFSSFRNSKKGASPYKTFISNFKSLAILFYSVFDNKKVRMAKLKFKQGLVQGKEFHNRMYNENALLREWVHKDTYLSEDGNKI